MPEREKNKINVQYNFLSTYLNELGEILSFFTYPYVCNICRYKLQLE